MLNITRKDKIKSEVVRSKTQVKDIKKVQKMKGQSVKGQKVDQEK